MEKQIKLKFKIGNIIEFEAEGTTEDVEKQRTAFMETVFPSAVEAVKIENARHAETLMRSTSVELLPSETLPAQAIELSHGMDLSRTNLSSFTKKYGELSDPDFVLFAVYFDEKKNDNKVFSIENVKQYYSEARRAPYSNNSALLSQLIKKGYIMETSSLVDKSGKFYMLTDDGLSYVENYVPKEGAGEKKAKKSHKPSTKLNSQYSSLTADDLNLNNYPKVKDQKGALNQLILALYIVTNENKGEWFSFVDINYLFTNIFEIPFNANTISWVINGHKSWFTSTTDDNNKKANKYKLLSAAKDAAKELCNQI
jgi:DNA-binding MarR family transcriptional regulator